MGGEPDDWHDTLLTWGAYRSGYTRSSLGFGRTVYERMIAGLKGVTCSKCIGRGVVTVIVSGEGAAATSKAPCPICKGKGKVKVATKGKINPACIPATNTGGPVIEEPPIYARIDRAMQKLTIKQRIVIISRYVDYPRRSDRDRRWENVNAWLKKIGERPVSRSRVENLVTEAKNELKILVLGE